MQVVWKISRGETSRIQPVEGTRSETMVYLEQSFTTMVYLTRGAGDCRTKYEEILSALGIRPLKAQAARGIMVKLRGDAAE